MIWQILIATVEARTTQLCNLLDVLAPQLSDDVQALVYRDNLEALIGTKRDALVDAATGTYVSHLDDDDMIPSHYVATITPLLGEVDYVSYDIAANGGGYDNFVVSHSLRHIPRWRTDGRDVDLGHLMPMRLELHRLGRFGEKSWQEDEHWGNQVRASGRVQTEHHIDRVLYDYRVSNGALHGEHRTPEPATTPNPIYPHVRYL